MVGCFLDLVGDIWSWRRAVVNRRSQSQSLFPASKVLCEDRPQGDPSCVGLALFSLGWFVAEADWVEKVFSVVGRSRDLVVAASLRILAEGGLTSSVRLSGE